MRFAETTWLSLTFPREVTTTQALAALLALNGLSTPQRREIIVLEAVGRERSVRHRLRVPTRIVSSVTTQLTAHLPGIVVSTEEVGLPIYSRAWRAWASTPRRSLATNQAEAEAHGLLAALSSVHGDEVLSLQWLLGPVRRPQAVGTRMAGSHRNLLEGVAMGAWVAPAELDIEARRALRLKQSLPGWRSVLQIGVRAGSVARERQLLGQMSAAVRTAQSQGVELGFNGLRPRLMSELSTPWRWGLTINVGELLGLTAWPLGDTAHLPVNRVRSRSLPTPAGLPRTGLILGDSSYGHESRPVALSISDARMHLHAIGATGSGKSTLLTNIVAQAMDAGRAVCVIEPKGDLVADVLARVPEHRLEDVVVIDPTSDRPVGLNPLHQPGVPPEVITDQLLAIFKGLFGDAIGPRTQDLLSAGLLTLASHPNMSLVALPLLFTDRGFRRGLTVGLTDRLALGPFWAWYEGLSTNEQATVLAPLMNKLRHLLLRPRLRRVIGQVRPLFEMAELFTRRRIVLIPTNKGLLGGESAGLLGSVALSMLWQATLGRSRIAPERRHTTLLVLDEFADFVHLNQDFGDVLTQARGLGLAVVAAHQHLGQLSPNLRAAVLTNARSRVVFTVSPEDAAVLTKGDPRVQPDDLASLSRYEAYARLMVKSEPQPHVSIRTLPAHAPLRNPVAAAQASAERYGASAGAVDATLEALVTNQPAGAEATTNRASSGSFGVKRRPGGVGDTPEATQ